MSTLNNNKEYLIEEDESGKPEASFKQVVKSLDEFIKSDNINELLEDEERKEIVDHCLKSYEDDLESMKDWLEEADEIFNLMSSAAGVKNTPIKNAANIKLPMISTAVMQASARMQSEQLKNGVLVKHKVVGGDLQVQTGPDGQPVVIEGRKDRKGKRVCKHLNWQILHKMENSLGEFDKIFTTGLSIGTAISKVWYDPIEGLNKLEAIPYDQIVINHSISSIEKAETVTHKIELSTRQIIEGQRFGYFSELYDEAGQYICIKDLNKDQADSKAIKHLILEQHCWLDLDKDGLPEPYIVTLHKSAKKLLRIKARYTADSVIFNNRRQVKQIIPRLFFSDYHCSPDPEGHFWSRGLGHLLLNLNDAGNAMINMLTNAGKLATMQGGFLDKNLRIKKGLHEIQSGEWVVADSAGQALKDGIVPFNYKEPSNVLFQLLGLLLEQSKAVSATSDLLSGQTSDSLANVSPNVVYSLMSEGLKVFSSVRSRFSRGQKKDIQKLIALNAENLNVDEYIKLVSPSPQEMQEMFQPINGKMELIDYNLDEMELQIVPVVDVNESTEAEKQIRSQALTTTAIQMAPYNVVQLKQIWRNQLAAFGEENIEAYVVPDMPPQPDPKMVEVQQQGQLDQAKLQLEAQKLELEKVKVQLEFQIKQAELEASMQDMRIKAQGILSKSEIDKQKADSAEAKVQLDIHKTALDHALDIEKTAIESNLWEKEIKVKDKAAELKKNSQRKDPTVRD